MLPAQWTALLESRTGTVLTQGLWSECSSAHGGFTEHCGVASRRMLCCPFNRVCPQAAVCDASTASPLLIPCLMCKVFSRFQPII